MTYLRVGALQFAEEEADLRQRESASLRSAITTGIRDENRLTNLMFHRRHPELQGRRILSGETALAREWLDIRNRLVRPLLSATGAALPPSVTASPQAAPQSEDVPLGPFGTLVASAPGRQQFTYRFTPEDALWTARFIVGEAGGRDDPDNRAVIWAMFNRYALLTHRYYPTFHAFLRAYSTPLQPVLKSWGAARRHMHRPEFVRTGGTYPPPHHDVPRGQLRRFLELQRRPWSQLPAEARTLALQALRGQVPNPIGNATEFGSTYVYFRDRHGRNPSDQEWRRFTEEYAARKNWVWIGPTAGLRQQKNAFFVQRRLAQLPVGVVRVVSSAGAER